MFANAASDEHDLVEFNVRPMQTVKQILRL
jgi:hypothetical protein